MSSTTDLPRRLQVKWESRLPLSQPNLETLLGIYELQKIGHKVRPVWVQTRKWDGSSHTGMTVSDPAGERPSIFWYEGKFQTEGWYLMDRLDDGSSIAFAAQDERIPCVPPQNGWKIIGWLSNYDCDGLVVIPLAGDGIIQACQQRIHVADDRSLLATLRTELKQANTRNDALEGELQSYQNAIGELQRQVRQASADNDKLKIELQLSQSETSELQRQLRQSNIDSDRYKCDLQSSRSEFGIARLEVDDATKRADKLYEELKIALSSMGAEEQERCIVQLKAELDLFELRRQSHSKKTESEAKLVAQGQLAKAAATSGEQLPLSSGRLDTSHDGSAILYSVGADLNQSGMSDALQTLASEETVLNCVINEARTHSVVSSQTGSLKSRTTCIEGVGTLSPGRTSHDFRKPREAVVLNGSALFSESSSLPLFKPSGASFRVPRMSGSTLSPRIVPLSSRTSPPSNGCTPLTTHRELIEQSSVGDVSPRPPVLVQQCGVGPVAPRPPSPIIENTFDLSKPRAALVHIVPANFSEGASLPRVQSSDTSVTILRSSVSKSSLGVATPKTCPSPTPPFEMSTSLRSTPCTQKTSGGLLASSPRWALPANNGVTGKTIPTSLLQNGSVSERHHWENNAVTRGIQSPRLVMIQKAVADQRATSNAQAVTPLQHRNMC